MDSVQQAEVKSATTVTDNLEPHNSGTEYAPLFDTESVTDEALKGEDTAEETADAEPKVDKPEESATKPDESKEVAETKEEKEPAKEEAKEESKDDKKAEAKEEPEKPPPGYVPQAALHQERQTTKTLKAEVARLTAELEKASTAPVEETDEFKEFKILNDSDFNKLLEDDPDEATRYQYKFSRYQIHQRQVQERQMAEKRATEANRAIIEESATAINELLPGIYEGKNEMAPKLVDFAEKGGINPSFLEVITDPRTKVMTSDGRSLLLGIGAAQLVQFLKGTYDSKSSQPDVETLKKTIESELRPKIEAEIQETLIKKLQADPDKFRSIDQIAGSGKKDVKPSVGVLSEAEFAKLSEQEQIALLGG